MAKRKGKSRHRMDWGQKFFAGEGQQEQFSPHAKLTQRAVKLPADRVAAEQENLEDLPKRQGMVVGMFPGGAIVHCEGADLICQIAKTFRAPEGLVSSTALAVGDLVSVALSKPEHASGPSQEDKDRSDGMILLREPRSTVLCRPLPRSGKHRDEYQTQRFDKVIVANMDTLLMIGATRDPPLRPGLIDRFLIVAERGELQPLLAINKIDLERPDEQLIARFVARGITAMAFSALTGEGLDALRTALSQRRTVLSGPSGVGKSTLVNALIPGAQAFTQTVRVKDQRGRHTTAAAVVYDLPGGGMIVDTPGVRELGVDLRAGELPWYFPEFEPYAAQCKFNDCTHTHEPVCAVRQAVDSGAIPPHRYDSYLRILDSLEGK